MKCTLALLFLLSWSSIGHAQDDPTDATPSQPEAASGEDDTASASVRFRRGVQFYEAGDHRAALIEFQRAYEIAPNYRVLFNLGQASFQLHDYAEARLAFERYLQEGGAEVSEERRAEVGRELDTLRQYVSSLTIAVNVEGAQISVDNQFVGTSPLDTPLTLSAGRREVSVSLEGYAPIDRVVDLAGGEDASLDLSLVSITSVSVVVPSRLSAGFWASLVGTSVVALSAVTTGILTVQANSDLDSDLQRFPVTEGEIQASRQRVERLALSTDILIGTLALGAVTTLLLGIFGRTSQEGESEDVAIRPTSNGFRVTF